MPKLLKKVAKEVAKSASDGVREPLPNGVYVVKLTGCKVAEKEGPSGPYWITEFTIPKGEEHAGRKFWVNLSLSENARWKMAEFFNAMGDPDCLSDTDDLIGKDCEAVIGTETQKQGANMGKERNVVVNLRPLGADDEDEEDDDDDDEDDEDDEDDDV